MNTAEFAVRLIVCFILCGVGGFVIGWYLADIYKWLATKIHIQLPRAIRIIFLVVIAYFWTGLVWRVVGLQSKIF